MNSRDNGDELDRQMEEAIAAKTAYREWEELLLKDCFNRGIAAPNSYAKQRKWNEYQKEQRKLREKEKKQLQLQAQVAKLQAQLGEVKEIPFTEDTEDPAYWERFDKLLQTTLKYKDQPTTIIWNTQNEEPLATEERQRLERAAKLKLADQELFSHNEGEIKRENKQT